MTNKRPAKSGGEKSPAREYASRLSNAAMFCLDVLRRWIVFAEAPAIRHEDQITVEALRKDLAGGRLLASRSPLGFLLQPLRECVEFGTQAMSEAAPGQLGEFLSDREADSVAVWADNWHEVPIHVAKNLYDSIRIVEPRDVLFSDPDVFDEREEAIKFFVEHEWQYRNINLSLISKRFTDEMLRLTRYEGEESWKQSKTAQEPDEQTALDVEASTGQSLDAVALLVEAALIGHPFLLARFQFLAKRKHATQFETIKQQQHCWMSANADVSRGLKDLRNALNTIDGAPDLTISVKNQTAILIWPD